MKSGSITQASVGCIVNGVECLLDSASLGLIPQEYCPLITHNLIFPKNLPSHEVVALPKVTPSPKGQCTSDEWLMEGWYTKTQPLCLD